MAKLLYNVRAYEDTSDVTAERGRYLLKVGAALEWKQTADVDDDELTDDAEVDDVELTETEAVKPKVIKKKKTAGKTAKK